MKNWATAQLRVGKLQNPQKSMTRVNQVIKAIVEKLAEKSGLQHLRICLRWMNGEQLMKMFQTDCSKVLQNISCSEEFRTPT